MSKAPVWRRLKDMLCPASNHPIEWKADQAIYRCTGPKCEFGMTQEAFDRTIMSLYNPRARDRHEEEDNLAALNNLGHDIPSKDYSDQL